MSMVDIEGFNVLLKLANKKKLSEDELKFLNILVKSDSPKKLKFLLDPEIKFASGPNIITNTPVLIDLSLTNKCNLHCSYCYMDSLPVNDGKFLSLDDFEILLKKMKEARVLQIALGGGEPTLHPNFAEILRKLRLDGDIVPNYTTNGTVLTNEILEASKKYCGAVAVSYMENLYKETLVSAKKLLDYGIQANVHIVLLKSRLQNLNLIVEKYLKLGVNGIVLLLFKPMGRGKNLRKEVLAQQDIKLLLLKIFEILALKEKYDFKLNFDACSAPLLKDMPFLAESIDGCNGSRYSCYIDWNLKVKPCSFMQDQQGVDLKNNSFKKIWQSELFVDFRNKLTNYRYIGCKTCNFFKSCWGGCPLDPSIVACDKKGGKLKIF